jgi:hypothetical protein
VFESSGAALAAAGLESFRGAPQHGFTRERIRQMAAAERVDARAGDDPRLANGILSRRISVVRHLIVLLVGTAMVVYPLYETVKLGQAYRYNYVAYVVLAWISVGVGVYACVWRRSPEKLAALGATMATGEIDFAERYSPSLSSGPERPASELPEPGLP